MTTTPVLKVNFNNYKPSALDDDSIFNGSEINGINIYCQKFLSSEQASTQLTNAEIIDILEQIIEGNISFNETQTTSVVLEGLELEPITGNTRLFHMNKNQIMVFECISGSKYSYYCYLKDNGNNDSTGEDKDGNSWLIYIYGKGKRDNYYTPSDSTQQKPNQKYYQYVIFDLEDTKEPTIQTNADAPTGTTSIGINFLVNSIETSNFKLNAVGGNTFDFSNIELKNTAFNLPTDAVNEDKVTLKPMGIIKPTA